MQKPHENRHAHSQRQQKIESVKYHVIELPVLLVSNLLLLAVSRSRKKNLRNKRSQKRKAEDGTLQFDGNAVSVAKDEEISNKVTLYIYQKCNVNLIDILVYNLSKFS